MFVQELTLEECRIALAEATFGRLACARENQPYVVPIYFAVSGDYIYSFAMGGQKIEWMRDNPLVCLEIDRVHGFSAWTSVVVLGRYEELPDTPDFSTERVRAHDLLERRAMWWLPGAVAVEGQHKNRDLPPIFYRIQVQRLTGHRGVAEANEMPAQQPSPTESRRSVPG